LLPGKRILGFGKLSPCTLLYNISMATPNPSRVKVKIPKKELADFCRRYPVQKLA